jgi:hypothetical protein
MLYLKKKTMVEKNLIAVYVFIAIVSIISIASLSVSIIKNNEINSNTINDNNDNNDNDNNDEKKQINANIVFVKNFKIIDENLDVKYEISQEIGKAGDILKLAEDFKKTTWKSTSENSIEKLSVSIKNSAAVFSNSTGKTLLVDSGVTVDDLGNVNVKAITVVDPENSLLYQMPISKGLQNQVLKKGVGSETNWVTPTSTTGGGDVTGPASDAENKDSLCLFDHETGKRIKSSKVYLQNDLLTVPKLQTDILSVTGQTAGKSYYFPTTKPENGDIISILPNGANQTVFKKQVFGNVFIATPPIFANIPVTKIDSRDLRATQLTIIPENDEIQAAGISSRSNDETLNIGLNFESNEKELIIGNKETPISITSKSTNYNFEIADSLGSSSNALQIPDKPIFISNVNGFKGYLKPPSSATLKVEKSQIIEIVNTSQTTELVIPAVFMFEAKEDIIIEACSTLKLISFKDAIFVSSGWLLNKSSKKIQSNVLSYSGDKIEFAVSNSKTISPIIKESNNVSIVSYVSFPPLVKAQGGFELNASTGQISYTPFNEFIENIFVTIIARTNEGYEFASNINLFSKDNEPNFTYTNTSLLFNASGALGKKNESEPVQKSGFFPPVKQTWSVSYGDSATYGNNFKNVTFSTETGKYMLDVVEDGAFTRNTTATIVVTNGNGDTQTIELNIFDDGPT